MKRLRTILDVLRRRGPGYPFYLVFGYLWPRWQSRLLPRLSLRRRRLTRALARGTLGAALGVGGSLLLSPSAGRTAAFLAGSLAALAFAVLPVLPRSFRRQRWLREARREAPGIARDAEIAGPARDLISWEEWPVEDSVRRVIEAARGGDRAIELGSIDADGRLLSPFGSLPGFDDVDGKDFLQRGRYDLNLVLVGDRLAVCKGYRGDRPAFEREWLALSRLAGTANVPAILAVDEADCRLIRSFLPGDTVNDLLVKRGARIRLAQTQDDPELAPLTETERLAAVLARGTELLGGCLAPGVLDRLVEQVEAIHRRGVTGLSLTFGNVMISPDGTTPWLFDFDGATVHDGPEGFEFHQQRDRDRRLLSSLYDLDLITETSARETLDSAFPGSYAPVDLGRGLASRGFWSVDSGTGRWEYLNGPVLRPLVPGKRILDLGSHNCVLPLLMLRAGARQVVAVEQSPEVAASARRLQELFEWRDMASYDLDLRCADMRTVLDADWGSFDIVSAFCSLYYLDEGDMARVVRRAAELAPMMVLQAKSDTRRRAAANKAEKSAPEFLKRLLRGNGFPDVRIVAPMGYSRPLLIGSKTP